MNINDKTLVILDESGNNKTTSIIVEEKDVVSKTKEFLEKITSKNKQAEVNVYSPVGVVLKSADSDENYAVAYQREKFVIVSHNGTSESAKLYGNWQEAIACVRRILNAGSANNRNTHFLLTQYIQESK